MTRNALVADVLSLTLTAALAVGVVACAESSTTPDPDGITDDGSDKPDDTEPGTDGKFDRWDYQSDPARFEGGLNHALAELPRSGRSASVAWPSTYWPTYHDSIQYRWNGELSPAEKYDRAFNGWTPPEGFDDLRPFNPENCDASSWDPAYYDALGPLASHVSANMGNAAARDGRDSDRDGRVDECDDHDGVATWWGLCHAWVPAALLEDRPMRSVTYNGVTFHVGDLEALLILAYNRSPASMLGGRCNLFDSAEEMATVRGCRLPDQPASEGDTRPQCTAEQLESYVVRRDEHGRPEQAECRDSNPGAMHVVLANYLGLQQRGFAYDRTFGFEVWNQPIAAFDVTRLDPVTAAEANGLLGVQGETYTYNPDAASLYDVRATVTYITESHASTTPANASRYERTDTYDYILEVDANGNIIGGEYYGSSRDRHPDFLWSPRRIDRSSVPNLDLENVRMLVQLSRQQEAPPVGAGVIAVAGSGGGAIPDNDAAGLVTTAEVDADATVGSVRVELDIDHTYVGDLRIVLEHGGVESVIHNNEGGSSDDLKTTVAAVGFEGVAARGTWTLRVVDSAARDVGTLNSWRLLVTPGAAPSDPDPGAADLTGTGTGGAIPDDDEAGFTSTVTLAGTGAITSTRIRYQIQHTYVGDLLVRLEHLDRTHVLHGNVGGDRDDIDGDLVVHTFDGVDAAGDWVLRVVDSAGQDVGRVIGWSVEVTTGEPPSLERPPATNEPDVFPGEGGLAIPDNDATGVTSEAGVPAGTTGSGVAIAIDITHTWRGDLTVVAAHGGQSWTLADRQGESTDDFVGTVVLDPAPTGDLGGTWSLTVSDHAARDTGTLNSWSVVVRP